jgi:hypothetical protein
MIFGTANADDFIGFGSVLISYEQIRLAAEEGRGVPIEMRLDQNPEEELYYKIEGQVRADVP